MKTFRVTIIFIVAFFTAVSVVLAIDIGPGANHTFVYNGSGNETFFCLEQSLSCSPLSLNLSLSPGETRNITSNYCSFSATCESVEVDDSGLCSIDRRLSPGERFERKNNVCDVDIECERDVAECVRKNETVRYSVPVRFYTLGNGARFEFGDEKRFIDENVSALKPFDYEFTVDYSCPVDVGPESFDQADLLQLCQQTNPYLLEWLDLALNQEDECDLRRAELEADLVALQSAQAVDVAGLEENLVNCRASNNVTLAAADRVRDDLSSLKSVNDVKNFLLVFAFVWALGATFAAIVMFRGREIDSEVIR